MTLPPLEPRRAHELVTALHGVRALVVGDVMLDRFIVGSVARISPEAPVPVVRFQSEHWRLGGAANVAYNMATLGARVSLVGIVGRDAAGDRVRELLRASGVSTDGLVEDADRPTVEKVRIVTGRNQQVARVDYEDDTDATGAIEEQLTTAAQRFAEGAAVVAVSDYLKGAVTLRVMQGLLDAATRNRAALIVDPKIPHLGYYAGASLITPNHHEAEAATNRRIRSEAEAREAALAFRERARCDAALITRGEHGMWLSSVEREGGIPALTREVSDVTGAGDTVVATLALALGARATLAEAALLANHAAGIVVGKFGPATVTPEELLRGF